MVAPEDFEQLPGLFAEVGVPLVYVRPFPGGRIDAVSMGVAGRPLIALSGRGKRLDKVFFALLHECGRQTNPGGHAAGGSSSSKNGAAHAAAHRHGPRHDANVEAIRGTGRDFEQDEYQRELFGEEPTTVPAVIGANVRG